MLNRWTGIGRWSKDIELRTTSGGKSVANCDLAVNEGGGEKKTTLWVPVVMWEKTAENVHKYSGKGRLVYVEGRLTSRTYDAQDGSKRKVYEVVASTVQFLDKKDAGESLGNEVEDDETPF